MGNQSSQLTEKGKNNQHFDGNYGDEKPYGPAEEEFDTTALR